MTASRAGSRTRADSDASDDSAVSLPEWHDDDFEDVPYIVLLSRLTWIQKQFRLLHPPATLVYRELSPEKSGRCVFEDVSGFLNPGMMVCIMGPGDSGISDLLKTLAGRQQGQVRGHILINGVRSNSRRRRMQLSYAPFEDIHVSEMTVEEAIRFSLVLRTSSLIPKAFLDLQVELLLNLLNLKHIADSRIGSPSVRGISGGERRRLTIGLEITAGRSVMLMDSATNGLDSNAALEIGMIVRGLTKQCERSALMSLVQVSPQLFALFDFVILQSRGRLVYFGPREQALPYMEQLGYLCPPTTSVPDFLAEICANPRAHYIGHDVPRDDRFLPSRTLFGGETHPDIELDGGSVESLICSFRNSSFHEDLGRVLWRNSMPAHPTQCHGSTQSSTWSVAQKALEMETSSSPIFKSSLYSQFWTCLTREIVMNVREKSKSFARLMRSVLVAFVTGLVFWQLDNTQAGAISRLGAIATIVGFVGYDGVEEITMIFASRDVFYMQRNSGYFRVVSFWLAYIIADIPLVLVQSVLLSAIFYGMAGFRDGLLSFHFVMFTLLILQVTMTGRAWTSFISNLLPSENLALTIALLTNDMFWNFQGYFLPADLIPKGWIWLYHASYFTGTFKALAVNELHGLPLKDRKMNLAWESGTDVLSSYSFYSPSHYHPIYIWLFSWGFYFLFQILSLACMSCLNFEAQPIAPPTAELLEDHHLVGIEESVSSSESDSSNASRSATAAPSRSSLQFRNLSYTVKGDIRLLDNVSGFAVPGMLIAMLGPSGAGKSTLLDVLAMRKTQGTITGEILINGEPMSFSKHKRMVAYVEQFDSLPSETTVREVISQTAQLTLSSEYDREEREEIVDELIEKLQLESVQDRIATHLSGPLRKKTSIAAALASVANESGLLFADEPTTGLDSSDALNIMQNLEYVSRDLPVICTIHQPSRELVESFGWVLLLKEGGVVTYFGPSEHLASYCQSQGYPPFNPDEENLAEYALRTICQDDNAKPFDAPDPPSDMVRPTSSSASYKAPSFLTTLSVLVRRRFLADWRDRMTLVTRMFSLIFLSFTFGTMFTGLALNTMADVMARLSLIFSLITLMCWTQAYKLSSVILERPCYYREVGSGMYDEATYFLASTLADTPYIIAQVLVVTIPAYMIAGLSLQPSAFFMFLVAAWLCSEASSSGVRLVIALSPNTTIACGLLSVLYTLYMTFGGFLLVFEAMPKFSIVFYYISFFRYGVSYCFAGEVSTWPQDSVGYRIGRDIMGQYGIDESGTQLLLGLIVVLAANRLLCLLVLKCVKHNKR
ncbi:unnamed protein product (mitochondrion) [Plasmodiophora brassicae]|uniref:ABC transporter domain-containing protein n=1 Tax=Plasmodiophora brassicae TaxID=37360 RepID=A0A3P3XYP7_PLABS|nr:unnamed protein product [Plasmodiophora brassicae]